MDTNTFRRFLLVSSLFIAAPLPLFAAIGFGSGDWTTAGLGLGFTAGLCVLYWWPLGSFLAAYKGRPRLRWVLGYFVSLPLYFVTLAVLYPLFGGTFRPFANGRLLIYLSATPQFYALVRPLHHLARRLPGGIVAAAGVTFSAA